MSAGRPARGGDVPDELRAEVEQIARRAARHGTPLNPMPELEIAQRTRHGSRARLGARDRPPRLYLDPGLLDLAPADRAWTIAHELAHVLRRQEGTRQELARGLLTTAGLLAVLAVGAVLAAGYLVLSGSARHVDLPFAVGVASVAGMWLLFISLLRREETETDAAAAEVFGEVLTAAGVERLRRIEGLLTRHLPTFLRSHPRAAARRQAGLTARGLTGGEPSPRF